MYTLLLAGLPWSPRSLRRPKRLVNRSPLCARYRSALWIRKSSLASRYVRWRWTDLTKIIIKAKEDDTTLHAAWVAASCASLRLRLDQDEARAKKEEARAKKAVAKGVQQGRAGQATGFSAEPSRQDQKWMNRLACKTRLHERRCNPGPEDFSADGNEWDKKGKTTCSKQKVVGASSKRRVLPVLVWDMGPHRAQPPRPFPQRQWAEGPGSETTGWGRGAGWGPPPTEAEENISNVARLVANIEMLQEHCADEAMIPDARIDCILCLRSEVPCNRFKNLDAPQVCTSLAIPQSRLTKANVCSNQWAKAEDAAYRVARRVATKAEGQKRDEDKMKAEDKKKASAIEDKGGQASAVVAPPTSRGHAFQAGLTLTPSATSSSPRAFAWYFYSMCVCMYVCMYVYIYIYLYIWYNIYGKW